MRKASTNNKKSSSPNFLNTYSDSSNPVSLIIAQNDKQFKIDDLNLNMVIKYRNEWYAIKLRENTMNDYYLIFRDELKPLKDHLQNYNSYISAIEQNLNPISFNLITEDVNFLRLRAETGIKEEEEEVFFDDNKKTKLLQGIMDKLEGEKRALYQFAIKEEIDNHYDKLKQIIFKIKRETSEITNNNRTNHTHLTNNFKVSRTLTEIQEPIPGETYQINNNLNKLSDNNLRTVTQSPSKQDVKVLIEEIDEEKNINKIFSYISDDNIVSNTNILDSNNYQINSNLDSRNLNSVFSIPCSDNIQIDSQERFMSNNSLIGMKRNIRDNDNLLSVNLFNSLNEEISQLDVTDIKSKKLKVDLINSLFSVKNHNLKLKRYSLNCIDCGTNIKIIKMENICCEIFLCKMCVLKNYTFLSELINNFNLDKYDINKCLSAQYKMFFCNYCYLLEKRENLIECSCALCKNLFHIDCYKMIKIVDRNCLNLDKTEKTLICEEIVSLIIEEEKSKKILINTKKLKNANLKFIQSSNDSGQLMMILYKFNICTFYKFFINYFVKYIIKNKQKFNPNFIIQKEEIVCSKHLCISCLQPINDLSCDLEEGFLKVCCNHIHKDCYDQDNSHLDYLYQKNSSHIPIFHFKFTKEFYSFVKKISKYNNYKSNVEEVNINVSYDNNNNNQSGEIFPENVLVDNNNLNSLIDYIVLPEKEKENVMQSFIEIFSNKMSRKISSNMEKKNKTQKGLSKCDCIGDIIKRYKNNMIPQTNKRYSNLRSSINSGDNINKIIKDKYFREFLTAEGLCCGDTCSNRILKIECFKKTCDCPADFCLNRYDRPKYYRDFEIIRTSNRGYGLICNEEIKKGEFIIEYIGEVIDYSILIEKSSDLNQENRSQWYVMSMDNNLYIDASKYGNKARFINHSCNPNAVSQKWLGDGYSNKIFLFASRDIPAGSEICFKYNFNYFKRDFQQDCKCGEKSCCRVMGGNYNASNINISRDEPVININNVDSNAVNSNSSLQKNNKANQILNSIKDISFKNPFVKIDNSYNLLIDKKILKEYGIDFSLFKKKINDINHNQHTMIKLYSYAKKYLQDINVNMNDKNNISNDMLFKYKRLLPLLRRNVKNVKRFLNMKFNISNNKPVNNTSHKNEINDINMLNEKFLNKTSCIICKSKEGFVKICESCKNSYHFNCVKDSLEKRKITTREYDQNFPCYDCSKLYHTNTRKKYSIIPKKLINEDFLKKLKQDAITKTSSDNWKITKNSKILDSKSNPEKISYSYVILRNEFINENLAIFYQHENFLSQNKKLQRKFEMLREKGNIQQFHTRIHDIFLSFINLI